MGPSLPSTAPSTRAARGRRWLGQYYADIDARLAGRMYALGDRFSLVDAYLVVFHKWAARPLAQPAVPPIPSYDAVMSRVYARPAVARILDFETKDR